MAGLKLSVKIDASRLIRGMEEFKRDNIKNMGTVVVATKNHFITEAKGNCPKDTGNLQDSIGNPSHKDGIYKESMGIDRKSITIGTKVPYGIYTEMGIGERVAKGKALKWKDKTTGKMIYRKRAGPIPAKWWFLKSVDNTRRFLRSLVKRGWVK